MRRQVPWRENNRPIRLFKLHPAKEHSIEQLRATLKGIPKEHSARVLKRILAFFPLNGLGKERRFR
jgi:hypothetical protein